MKGAILWLFGVAVLTAATMFADGAPSAQPNLARGINVNSVYRADGIETVNLFNGNLQLSIPLGISYPVGGNLSYQFMLVHNSKLWDYVEGLNNTEGTNECCDPIYTGAYPNRSANAGFGWRISLGELHEFPQAPWMAPEMLAFEGPDGAAHVFDPNRSNDPNVQYTGDGLRARRVTNLGWDIDLGNGTTYRFLKSGNLYFLASISDAFGNAVTIVHSGADWIVNDSAGRTHYVTSRSVAGQSTNYANVIDTLDTMGFAASPGVPRRWKYRFQYSDAVAFQFGCGDNLPAHYGATLMLPQLNSVSVEEGSSFAQTLFQFTYNTTRQVGGPGNCNPGTIASVKLPTGGTLAYDYGLITIPTSYCDTSSWLSSSPAVTTKHALDGSGVELENVEYVRAGEGYPSLQKAEDGCAIQLPNSMTSPRYSNAYRNRLKVTVKKNGVAVSRHYFSTWAIPFSVNANDPYYPNPYGFDAGQFGLPLTRYMTANAAMHVGPAFGQTPADPPPLDTHRFLSSEALDTNGDVLQSAYVEYEDFFCPTCPITLRYWGWQHRSESNCYRAENGNQPKCGQTVKTDFDGYGHYRTSTASTEFLPPSELSLTEIPAWYRTTTTNYNPGTDMYGRLTPQAVVPSIAPDQPWITGAYTSVTAAERDRSLDPAGARVTSVRTDVVFDSRGFLTKKRILAGSAPGVHDLLAVYSDVEPGGGSFGNVTSEKYYGGDIHAVPATPGNASCSSMPPADAPEFSIEHTHSHGVRKTSKYTCANFLLLDQDVDPSGLIAVSRDSAGTPTSFSYDALGRVTWIKPSETIIPPQGETGPAALEYVYIPATAGTPPVVQMNARPWHSPSGTALMQGELRFDAIGRLTLERMHMPAGWMQRQTFYDAMGRKSKVTEWDPAAGAATEFGYDSLDRIVSVKTPDLKIQTTAYPAGDRVQRTVSVATGAGTNEDATTVETYDAGGRLKSVKEASGIQGADVTTDYAYDLAGHLREVSTPAIVPIDTPNGPSTVMVTQHRQFDYDNRGFLTSETHPEKGASGKGTTYYSNFDSRGHLHNSKEGTAACTPVDTCYDLELTYDGQERITRITDVNPNNPSGARRDFKMFDYNGSGYGLGRLASATRYNHLASAGFFRVTDSYQYTSSGIVAGKQTTVEQNDGFWFTNQTFNQAFVYNDFGQMTGKVYPSLSTCSGCPARTVTAMYADGYLQSIPGYASSLTYHPSGMLNTITHSAGGIVDTYERDDSGMSRPKAITFGNYQCVTPTAPVTPSSTTMCPGGNSSASVAEQSNVTYLWSITNGTLQSSPALSWVTFSAGSAGTTTLTVTVASECGTATGTASISVGGGPVITSQPSGTTTSGPGVTLSVSASGSGLTYQWYQGTTPGSAISGATASSYTTPPITATTSYWVKVMSGCGNVDSNAATVTFSCVAPAITAQPAGTTTSGAAVTLSVSATGAGLTYQWYQGTAPGGTAIAGGTASSYTTPAITATTSYWVKVTNTCGSVNSTTATVTLASALPAPAWSNAYVTTTAGANQRQVHVSWPAVSGAGSYRVERRTQLGSAVASFIAAGTSYDDTVPTTAVTAYLYRIVALPSGGTSVESPPSPTDLALTGTTLFTNDPLSSAVGIFGRHVQELRAAIDALRYAAGLSPVWSGTAVTGPMYAADITSLQTPLSQARTALGFSSFAYGNGVPAAAISQPVLAAQLQQIREALR
jgi:YD repeat-containing protein